MPFLNPDRRPKIKHPTGHSLDVIASFKTTGEFIPLYFQIEDDYHERFKIKIDAIKLMKDRPGIKIYECVYNTRYFKNVITLIFDINECRWSIG
jgi:hypothetical protein